MSEPSERPAIASAPISVILFASGPSAEIHSALQSWRAQLAAGPVEYEILLIIAVAPDTSAFEGSDLRVFPYDPAHGFREALADAVRAARFPLMAFSPCDTQYRPGDLQNLLKVIDKVDMVVGYRPGLPTPFWRVLLDTFIGPFSRFVLGIPLEPRRCWLGPVGRGRRWIARWIFGVRVADPECPFRLARRSVFDKIVIQSHGSFVHIEILAKANHLGALFTEVPVAWTPSPSTPLDASPFGDDARRVFRTPEFRWDSLAAPP